MKEYKYKVQVPYAVYVTVTVEVTEEELLAEEIVDEDDIEEYVIGKALKFTTVKSFSGNGGNKLIGVDSRNTRIECCDDPLDGEDYCFVIEVEKINED